ncbi:MAG: phenylalanine--tRNA ligase subunit beta, partial [Candidatus Magasanikbacteria bacterium]|nr:phenylalanine--tRNA ligase subunit beta [Candidatus Magasanikbacteria bacterium]
MNISYNWLKKFITLPDSITPEQVAEKLKLSTVEVENIIKQGDGLDNIVVGKVLKADKHPNADKLKLCLVDVGKESLQIVCGGSNVVDGMSVAVAKVGAKVHWHGEKDLVEIVPTKIREVDSYGMICGSSEIGLEQMFPPKDEKEILDLTELKLKIGMDLKKALGLDDVVFEIDNKSLSNRPDLWGHYGIAREVAVLFPRDLKEYETTEIEEGKDIKLKVDVDDIKLCPRYMAVAVGGIKIGPSPLWLQQSLSAVGLRSINNVVDITNYIMYDLGQPLHAFDANNLKTKNKNSKTIIVRTANPEEEFKLLDEKVIKLTENDLVIADEEKPIALAGVMGGFDSGINDNTTTIIFESANFEPVNIRKTALRYDSRTDSSSRFEKSLDPNMNKSALEKAVEMILEFCPEAKVVSNVVDITNYIMYDLGQPLHAFDANNLK